MAKKKSTQAQRSLRAQQIVFGIIGVLVILSMVLGMLMNY